MTAITETTSSYRIPECNLSELYAQVVKLNAKATKLGLDRISVTETGEEFETILRCRKFDHTGCLHNTVPSGPFDTDFKTIRFVNVQVSGLAPKIAGWTFLATIEHEEAGNIIRRVPGTDAPIHNSYRTSPAACHHCHQKRDRKDTYLLVDGQGQVVEVGHNCLKDFLGHKDPHAIASFLEALNALEVFISQRDDEIIRRSPEYTYTEEYLGHVAAIIRTEGWLSGGKAYETGRTSTAQKASMNLEITRHPQTNRFGDKIEPVEVTEADQALVRQATKWGRELITKTDSSDYEHNLAVALASDRLEYRNQGIVASVISAFKRATEEKVEAKAKVERPESNWIGEVGKRETFDLTIERSFQTSSDFGITTIINFIEGNGNRAVWFASGELEVEAGAKWHVKATVKAHNTNRKFGYKETVLSRVAEVDAKGKPIRFIWEGNKLVQIGEYVTVS